MYWGTFVMYPSFCKWHYNIFTEQMRKLAETKSLRIFTEKTTIAAVLLGLLAALR